MGNFKIGQKIRIHVRHWLRAKEVGRIVAFDPERRNHWLVELADRGPGMGITLENGKQGLWLDDFQIEAISPTGEKGHRVKVAA